MDIAKISLEKLQTILKILGKYLEKIVQNIAKSPTGGPLGPLRWACLKLVFCLLELGLAQTSYCNYQT